MEVESPTQHCDEATGPTSPGSVSLSLLSFQGNFSVCQEDRKAKRRKAAQERQQRMLGTLHITLWL